MPRDTTSLASPPRELRTAALPASPPRALTAGAALLTDAGTALLPNGSNHKVVAASVGARGELDSVERDIQLASQARGRRGKKAPAGPPRPPARGELADRLASARQKSAAADAHLYRRLFVLLHENNAARRVAQAAPDKAAAIRQVRAAIARDALAAYVAEPSEDKRRELFAQDGAWRLLREALPEGNASPRYLRSADRRGEAADKTWLKWKIFDLVAQGKSDPWSGAHKTFETADGRSWQVAYVKDRANDTRAFLATRVGGQANGWPERYILVFQKGRLAHNTEEYDADLAVAVTHFAGSYAPLRPRTPVLTPEQKEQIAKTRKASQTPSPSAKARDGVSTGTPSAAPTQPVPSTPPRRR